MYCVIVGDIIQSKEMEPEVRESVTRTIKDILNHINTKYMDFILASFGLVRGDAFEGVLFTQEYAPKIIQEIIKSFYRVEQTKVRISAVMDELTIISSDRNEADGPAFHIAANKINEFKAYKNEHWMQISLITKTIAQPIIDSLIDLLTALTENWTDRQREIVWAMDDYSGQRNVVSKKFKIPSYVVNKQLKAANYNAYHQAWLHLERYLIDVEEDCISENGNKIVDYTAYYSVAKRKNKMHEYDEAIPLFHKAIDIAKKELGDNNPQLSIVYNGLAETYIEKEFYDKAKDVIDLSLELQRQLPKARLEYAKTLNLLGDLLLASNRIEDALKYYSNAVEIALITVGEDHPFVYLCHNNIAVAYKRMSVFEKALEHYFIYLKYAQKYSDHDPLSVRDILYNISLCYEAMGDADTALNYAEKSLEISGEFLPRKDKKVIATEDTIRKLVKNRNTGEM